MARKNRNLAGFDEVASDINKNVNINKDDNVNANKNADIPENNNVSPNDGVNNNPNENINVNDQVNNDDNINANDNIPTPKLDYLDKLIEGAAKKNSETGTVLTGIYLQKDILQVLDRLAKKGGRGAKSRIVNEALRSVFMEKGLL